MGRPRKVQPELQPAPSVSSSPRWLIIVSDASGPRLFSAHCTEDAAQTMRDSLDGLTAATVTMLEVPSSEGIMKAEPRKKPAAPLSMAECSGPPAPVALATFEHLELEPSLAGPSPTAPRRSIRKKSAEQIEMETARALAAGGSQIISDSILDDDEPIS